MATRNWLINIDSSVIESNWGNTVDQHHAVGLWDAGWIGRAFLKFTLDTSSMVTITSAILWLKSTGKTHTGFGASPTIRVKRLTSTLNNTQGGSSEGTWSTSADPAYDIQPTSTTTDQSAATNMTTATNTWDTVDITAIAQYWLGGGTNYGVLVKAEVESTGSDTWEFYSKDSSYDPYIVVTYTTNVAPSAPISMTPTGGTLGGLTPTLALTHSDPDGDALLDYDLQVSTDSTFASVTHWNIAAQTTGITGNNVSRTYGGTALTRGTTYYWRARTSASAGVLTEGSWSGAKQFKVASLPTTSVTEPSATGRLGKLSFTAGSGWTSPRLNVAWSFACADGGTQSTYEVEVYNDTAGSPGSSLYDSGPISSVVQTLVVPATLTEGAYYHVRVQVKCSHNETSAFTGYFRIRTRWGASSHRKDLGSLPTAWSVSTLSTTSVVGSSSVVVEYNGSTDGTTVGTWMADLSSVTLKQWVHYRVWMLVYGASPVTTPSLNQLVVSYTATVLVPDKWTREDTVNSYASEATYVYGTQSLQHTNDAATINTYQVVTVVPNTDYILSARMKSSGNSQAQVAISSSGGWFPSAVLAATSDWARYNTVVWNSGASTSVTISCYSNGAVGTYAWFDAIKMEASLVVTPWVPSLVGSAVVLDAGGLQIDGSAGGIFRYRGITGGTRDRVDGGSTGLKFGGDVEVSSPASGILKIANASGTADETVRIGDDADIYDVDVADRIGIKGQTTAANGGIVFGSGKDTNLYRSAADILKTDDAFEIGVLPAATPTVVTLATTASAKGTVGNPAMDDHTHGMNMEGGTQAITPVASTPTSVTISGLVSKSGVVMAQATAATTVVGSTVQGVAVSSPTATSFILWVYRTNTTSTTIYWLHYGT